MRDPLALGELLLALQKRRAPLSRVYDRNAGILERVPPWAGDGLMSNDPAQHHSKVKQTHLTQTPAPGGQA